MLQQMEMPWLYRNSTPQCGSTACWRRDMFDVVRKTVRYRDGEIPKFSCGGLGKCCIYWTINLAIVWGIGSGLQNAQALMADATLACSNFYFPKKLFF